MDHVAVRWCRLSLGLIGSVAVMNGISKLLYDVRPTDPAVFVAITILLAAGAFIAAYMPARRATTTDPMIVLRIDWHPGSLALQR